MAKQLQLRKGTATEHDTFTGANGEVTVDTTNKTLRVHDGVTVGGTMLATFTEGPIPATQLPVATTSTRGIVKLNNSLTSTSVTEALTAQQGWVLSNRDFGFDQTWDDFTAFRAKATTYTNTTGTPISVAVIASYYDQDGGLQALVDGVTVGELYGEAPGGNGYWKGTLNFTVPNLSTYRIEGGSEVLRWVELR